MKMDTISLFQSCHNYSRGLVSGSLCPHLCTSKDIKYIECLGHKDDDFKISLLFHTCMETCGTLFGVEFVPSTPFNLPIFKDSRSWDFRAKLAISLIELVEKLEKTDYGTLYLCDVQEGNFGVVEIDGQYVVKSIDNDISLYEKSLLKDLFISRHPIIKYPLLHDPPSQIQKDLKSLLHQCAHPLKPSIHISWTLANKLKRAF
ncbi:uncharacterized protein LOC121392741 [Gigantopelta aegis]|uniref:uncharacterized protein LOC121392741 n=1 Tax=Gigantopelta aegis TaxID=1735272 RepID=UPI001B88A146|nr:uncharacterized protein LOC121392741 [Gigantopelta aegis]